MAHIRRRGATFGGGSSLGIQALDYVTLVSQGDFAQFSKL
jgi:hypothetical protein